MWDMKPEAPAEYRGEFQPIDTSASGIQITEHLPLLSRHAHHLAFVRALEMPGVQNSHPWGYYYMLTGHPPDPARYPMGNTRPRADDWPFLGSVVAAKLAAPHDLPTAVQLPWIWDLMINDPYCGGFAGRLGRVFNPFLIGFDPKTTAYAKSSELFKPQPPNPARWQSAQTRQRRTAQRALRRNASHMPSWVILRCGDAHRHRRASKPALQL
jgi:hypothetical protein